MSGINGPAPRPCGSCPYRRDVPSGVWHPDEYDKLLAYDEETAHQPLAVFQCHQQDADDPGARMCAGWVGVHGPNLLALRIAVATGRVDPKVLDYTTPTPLFASGAEAAEHGRADVNDPSPAARHAVAKIVARRSDVGE